MSTLTDTVLTHAIKAYDPIKKIKDFFLSPGGLSFIQEQGYCSLHATEFLG